VSGILKYEILKPGLGCSRQSAPLGQITCDPPWCRGSPGALLPGVAPIDSPLCEDYGFPPTPEGNNVVSRAVRTTVGEAGSHRCRDLGQCNENPATSLDALSCQGPPREHAVSANAVVRDPLERV
jgi:hypothetical protein